jgi:hypothetical protein
VSLEGNYLFPFKRTNSQQNITSLLSLTGDFIETTESEGSFTKISKRKQFILYYNDLSVCDDDFTNSISPDYDAIRRGDQVW